MHFIRDISADNTHDILTKIARFFTDRIDSAMPAVSKPGQLGTVAVSVITIGGLQWRHT